MMLVAKVFSFEEAKQIADQFDMQGYKTKIVQSKNDTMELFEVWVDRHGKNKGEEDLIKPRFLETKFRFIQHKTF